MRPLAPLRPHLVCAAIVAAAALGCASRATPSSAPAAQEHPPRPSCLERLAGGGWYRDPPARLPVVDTPGAVAAALANATLTVSASGHQRGSVTLWIDREVDRYQPARTEPFVVQREDVTACQLRVGDPPVAVSLRWLAPDRFRATWSGPGEAPTGEPVEYRRARHPDAGGP